jgi:hypothetical protein
MSILTTNAPMLFDADGDFAGYAIPDCDPVSINTKWVTKWGKDDELVWAVTWANGIVADMFDLPRRWDHIKHDVREKVAASSLSNLAGVDRALVETSKPLERTTA